MRPEKLIMENFGPFVGRETVDFTTLEDIFLITGKNRIVFKYAINIDFKKVSELFFLLFQRKQLGFLLRFFCYILNRNRRWGKW